MLEQEDIPILGRTGGNAVSEIFNSSHGLTREADLALGKKIMEKLVGLYPMHNWGVEVNHESGHAVIRLIYQDIQGEKRISNYGYVMHINKIQNDGELTDKVRTAGGEWLERYNITRGKATPDDIIAAHLNHIDLVI